MKIALLGDTAFYGKFCLKYGTPKKILEKTADVLKHFDYVVLNLETPFASDNAKRFGNKSAYIKSDPENIELLKYLGVDAVCLANNHMFDFGYKSYNLTKKILSENGIDYFGVENKDLKITICGNKIAFSGYCCFSTNPINASSTGVNPLDYKIVENKLKEDQSLGYASIISIHAGQEHINYPNYDHVEMARKLSLVYSYIYYGHHPHVLQGVEEFNDSLFAYSLGNFCFDDVYTNKSKEPLVKMNENNHESAILSLQYDSSKLTGYEFIPLFDGGVCERIQKDLILRRISEYSARLQDDKEVYNEKRTQLLNAYLQSRKSKRDLNWYLKRLNYNSYKIIMNSYQNTKKYTKLIKNHL
ncbi:CapA family protein [uncultured Proteiniphilum sp.]|uniref:CapA family protein n=1 Tax=uncultured Proteiniphilum sp. TaxID=497637 RepID=UPI002615CC03|nr:CapA family protein [uncultured Proteiniphilum sp.]